MARYQLTTKADADIDGIYEFTILKFGLVQAHKYLSDMDQKFAILAVNPSFGSDYGFVLPELQRAELPAHSIYYRAQEDGILILRILGNRQDPALHL